MRLRVVIVLILTAVSVRAGTITTFTNFGPAPGKPGPFWIDGAALGGPGDQEYAFPFTSAITGTLWDVLVGLGNSGDSNTPVEVYLESDDGSGTQPGSVLTVLSQIGTIPPFQNSLYGGGIITFTCSTCPTITAGTQYWIVPFEPDPDSQQNWMLSNYDIGPGDYNLSNSPTGPWSPFPHGSVGTFQIDESVPDSVPEASSWTLAGIGLIVVLLRGRKTIPQIGA